MELLEEIQNMLLKQNQKIESMLQENQYLKAKVSSLTADISRLDGYLQQSPAPRVLLSDQHCSIPLQLRFLNSCKNDKYSKHKIEADDKTPLKVVIYGNNNEIITSEPFSSMRVHIVPIQGDFDNDQKGQWTKEYFLSKIVSGRSGKEPLLFGDLYIRLKDGVGYLNTAKFQDNSSFVASKTFKLGAMAADIRIPQRIQEGITESFSVKDIRGYSTKKNLYPSPQDPVYKLRRIAKDGDRHKLLEQNGIKTVEDFVLSYNQSQEDLRKILRKISDQDWDMVIDHAQKCNPRPGNHDHQVISRSDGSRYFEGSSSMQPTSSAPQKQLQVQGMHQQSSSTYTELSSGASLEDAPREQVGIQVEDQISGAGNEVPSVIDTLLEWSRLQQVHSSAHFTSLDDEWSRLQQVHSSAHFTSLDDDFSKDALSDVPVTEDYDFGWGGYYSAFEQSAGCRPASEAGSCGAGTPVTGARGQGCPRLQSSPTGGASSSSYQTHPAPLFWGADNINNATAHFTDEELRRRLLDLDEEY
ncbi:uncharacterized protein [Miscanthus floridulus]